MFESKLEKEKKFEIIEKLYTFAMGYFKFSKRTTSNVSNLVDEEADDSYSENVQQNKAKANKILVNIDSFQILSV